MSFETMVARRHLSAMRRRRRVSVAAIMAVAGVSLGVAALGVVMSVSNGFSSLLWDRLLGLNAHVTVQRQHEERIAEHRGILAKLSAHPGVLGAVAFIRSEGLIVRRSASGGTYSSGAVVQGMDAEGLVETTDIASYMWAGEVDLGIQETEGGGKVYGMVIGRYLADRLGALLGSEVHLGMMPETVGMGAAPQFRRYAVTGIFDSGYPEFDARLAFVCLPAARRERGWRDGVSGVRIRLRYPFDADTVAEEIRQTIGKEPSGLVVSTWISDHASLYSSIRLEKWSFFLALTLIVVVAGFNIVSILTMGVAERRREIGILKAMGSTRTSIGRIFTLQGLAIGGTGIVIGNLLSATFCWLQARYELIGIPGDLFIINALPVQMRPFDYVAISSCAAILCYLFTRFPARDAASVDPVAGIRM